MQRKTSFKKGILRFAAVASAFALAVVQFQGYSSTAFVAGNGISAQAADSMTITEEKTGNCGEGVTYKLTTDGALTITGTGAMTSAPWSDYNGNITSVSIGDGVTTIYQQAFEECSKLTSLTIANSVTTIGKDAFLNCIGLTSLTLPSSLTTIGALAFEGCLNIAGEVSIPNTVTSIGASAFRNCEKITGTFTIPEGADVKADIIRGCTSLTKVVNNTSTQVTLPELSSGSWVSDATGNTLTAVTKDTAKKSSSSTSTIKQEVSGTIGNENNITWKLSTDGKLTITGTGEMPTSPWTNYASSITSVSVGEGITTIASGAFMHCKNLTSVSLPSTLKKILLEAFADCTSLKSIVIPNGVEYLDYGVFQNCSGLTGSIDIPSSVKHIGKYVFNGCTGLNGTITIPSSATEVEQTALKGCYGIQKVVNNSSSKIDLPVKNSDGLDFWVDSSNQQKEISSVSGGQTAVRKCKVQFNVQGSVYTEQTVNAGDTVVKPADPVLDKGYGIEGWEYEYGKAYDFSTPVTEGMTLYANMTYTISASSPVSGSPSTSGPSDSDDNSITVSTGSTTTATTPVTVGVSGADTTAVANAIKEVATGSTVSVDMSENKTITADVLEAAKGKNVDVVLDMGGYTWTINGSQITGDNLHDVNMNVSFGTNNISQNEISSLVGNNSYQTISLDYDGPFGFTASLGFNVGSANVGMYVNLYYYTDAKVMEYQNSGIVDEQGNTTLTFSHASEYVAVIDSVAHTSSSGTSAKSPVTADAAATVPFILLMCAAAAAMFGARASKKRHN